jgi:hypothetical protein
MRLLIAVRIEAEISGRRVLVARRRAVSVARFVADEALLVVNAVRVARGDSAVAVRIAYVLAVHAVRIAYSVADSVGVRVTNVIVLSFVFPHASGVVSPLRIRYVRIAVGIAFVTSNPAAGVGRVDYSVFVDVDAGEVARDVVLLPVVAYRIADVLE